ncbi:hypothetical protein [Ulvibacterium sp.]|uniref:hypothetical protein n=1 Tax=Ulvibacterium sp. TaxID=2665914 RepID=UPI00262572A4|nr:hypothetical protein [Ulvibacterium sp.]
MATDGTKIIDGDTANDTYWGIMDLYDSGAELQMIVNEFPLEQLEYFDDFDNEIYVTSCGLAYWELGLMTAERLDYIKKVISKDACIKEWASYSEKEGKSRKTVLKRYLNKVEKANKKIRKRKKYRKITNFIFSENSVLTFQLSNNEYAVNCCVKINQYRGSCNYWLVPITYKSTSKPTIEQIMESEILGRTIGSGFSREQTQASQPGIEKIWDYVGGKPNFYFGFVIQAVEHKDLMNFKNKFEKIGELNIIEGLKEIGSIGGEDTYERYDETYTELDNQIKVFGYQKYPIRIFINL